MIPMERTRLAAVLAAIALAATPVLGQQQPTSTNLDTSVLGEIIDVRVVNLEAVVTDRSGRRVEGLTADDFRLTVDGREVPVRYFSEIQDGEVNVLTTASQHLPPALEFGAAGTNFLLYVDDNHTLKRERDILVKGLLEDLDDLGRHDSMAIVVQSGTNLLTLAPWTNDRDVLAPALGRLLDGSEFGGVLRSPIRVARQTRLNRSASVIQADFGLSRAQQDAIRGLPSLSEGRLLGNPAALPSLPSAWQFNIDTRFDQLVDLEFALTGAISTLRGFDKPDGRKVLLMMTGEWPLGNFPRGIATFDTLTELELMDPLIETANLLGYTLYPVNENASSSIWRNATFSRVARRTGGRTLNERRSVLTEAVADTRSYYWLGFTPDLVGSDAKHRIRLQVLNRNHQVRSRRGYVDLSRSAQLAMDTQGALLFGEEIPNTGLDMIFGEPFKTGLRKMTVPLTIQIPLDSLTSIPVRGEELIEIEVRFAVVNENGATADVPTLTRVLRGENRQGDTYQFDTELVMRRARHQVLVSIYDRASGRTLMTRGSVQPSGSAAGQF